MTLTLTLTLPLTLALTLPLPLTLALALPLPLTLPLTLALALALTLGAAARAGAALPLALLLTLPLLTLALLAGIGEVATRVLEPRRRLRQVAVRRDVLLRAVHRVAEPIECGAGTFRIALGEALGSGPERGGRGTVRCLRGRLHLGELLSQLATFRFTHRVELVAELVEVLARLLRIAVSVRVRVPRRRP